MKHLCQKPLFLVLCLFAGTQVFAYDALIDGIYYNLSGSNAEVTYKSCEFNDDGQPYNIKSDYSGAVVIPRSVTYSGRSYSVTSIGGHAFYFCRDLTSVTIPEGVTSIGESAFYHCVGLSPIAIPESVKSIGKRAFMYCRGLTSINIPDNVTSIGEKAFWACSELTSIVVGNGVSRIADSALDGGSELTTVTLGKNVTDIEGGNFYCCDNLKDVYCYAKNVPTTGSSVFTTYSIDTWWYSVTGATLHVPAGSVDSYKATLPWSKFGSVVALDDYDPDDDIEDESAALIGTWKKYFGQSGQNYIILTFSQDGKVRYQEYDGGVWQHDETYSFTYSGNSLKIYDSSGRLVGTIQVLNLTSTELKLYNWPDYGEQTFTKQSQEQEASAVLNGSIIGQWNIVSGTETRYENGVQVSQQGGTLTPPYDRFAFYENGTFVFLEHNSSGDGHHEDGSGTYSIVDNKFVYGSGEWNSFVITSFDGSNSMEVVFRYRRNSSDYVVRATLQRVTDGGGDPDPEIPGEFLGAKRIFGDNLLQSYTRDGKTYTFSYDSNGFVTKVERRKTDGTAKTYTITYGDKIVVRSSSSEVWTATLNSDGFIGTLEVSGTSTSGEIAHTSFTYNADGQLTLVNCDDDEMFRLDYTDGDITRSTFYRTSGSYSRYYDYSYETSSQGKILNTGCVMAFQEIYAVDMEDDECLLYYIGALGKPTKHLPLAGSISGMTITGSWTLDDAGRATKAVFNGGSILWTWADNGGGQGGGEQDESAALIGTWKKYFGQSGQNYIILTFTQDGKVRYQEYDGGVWQHDETYTFTYSGNSLKIYDSNGSLLGTIQVLNLTSTELKLYNWPDYGEQTFTKQSQEQEASAVLNGSIIGQWNIVSGTETRYENGVQVSQQGGTLTPPYDRFAFYENGTFVFLEHNSSGEGHHEDGSGTYSIVDNRFVYGGGEWDSFVITSFDGSNSMEVVFRYRRSSSGNGYYEARVVLQRVTDGGGDDTGTGNNIDGIYYSFTESEAVVVAGNTAYRGKVVIPSSVTYEGKTYPVGAIGENAFQNCTGLTAVSIPTSVRHIQKGAFSGCAFQSLMIKCSTPPTLEAEGIFRGATGTVYVPTDSYESYLSDDDWKVLGSSIKPFETVTTKLPSHKWSQANYKVVAMSFDATEDYGSQSENNPKHNVIVGTPSKDANGRDWYALDYQCEWDMKTAPLNHWCEHNGDIYVRRVFCYDRELPAELFLACGNDDAPCEYYLNGELIWSKSNGWFEKEIYQMNSSQIALLKPGELNVLAYHVHQNWGDMYADSGLYPEWSMESISYRCGDNLTWSLDGETGTLTVSGTGRMNDYWGGDHRTEAPWGLLQNSIKHVEIQPGVTSIGNSAFYGCGNLTSVVISESVKSVGNNAFKECTNLTDVYCYAETIPETRDDAFNDSPVATATLHVPGSSSTLYKTTSPWSRFGTILYFDAGADGYAYVDGIHYSLSRIYATVIAGDTNYTGKVTIPSYITYDGKSYTVTSIGENAFQNCTGLTTVSIPSSVWHIQKGAFSGCAFQTLMVKSSTPPTLDDDGIFQSATGTVYVPTEGYETYLSNDGWKVLADNIKPFDIVTTKLPSHKWSQANYRVVAISFDADESYGSNSEDNPKHNVIVGTPSKDANGRDWYAPDYQCEWEVKAAPLNNWCEHNGDIYVRRVFFYDRELPAELFLACGNDDAPCEYYLNGELIWSKSNGWFEKEIYQMNSSQIALLKPGELNVLAYHVHQNWGGMYADSGLYPEWSMETLSYQCGDNLTWSFDGETGTLTISGTGRMSDYGEYDYRTNAPWCLILNSIRHIEIQPGVTSIGNSAFYGCDILTSVIISENVKSIGSNAFRRCTNLTDVYCYAENVPETGSGVFDELPIERATLRVFQNSLDQYKAASPWNRFGSIIPVGAEKCAEPTISYSNGELTFNCETEGVTYHYNITDDDIESGVGKTVKLTVTYHITVYATKPNWEKSEVVHGTLCWIDQQPEMEGVTDEDAILEVKAQPVLVQSHNGTVFVQGVPDGTMISLYSLDGKSYGSTIAKNDGATLKTNFQPGSVVIVKVGEKAFKVRL